MAVKKDITPKNTQKGKNIVWTTKRVDEWMKDFSEGIKHKDSPWADGVIGVRNPNLVFEYTPEEIEEITKCANDIIYFCDTYGYCMQGSKGYQPIVLRDYQTEMLESYENNRFTITLSSRQIGKCSIFGEIEIVDNDGNEKNVKIEELYHLTNPNKTIPSRIKRWLYKIYNKL